MRVIGVINNDIILIYVHDININNSIGSIGPSMIPVMKNKGANTGNIYNDKQKCRAIPNRKQDVSFKKIKYLLINVKSSLDGCILCCSYCSGQSNGMKSGERTHVSIGALIVILMN